MALGDGGGSGMATFDDFGSVVTGVETLTVGCTVMTSPSRPEFCFE